MIEAKGTILSVKERAGTRRIAVEAPGVAERLKTGDSIAVSGVCLTALDIQAPVFHADLAAETVARTSLARLAPGTTVNLELPTPAGVPLGGHIVQGHVDATGTLLSLYPIDPEADRALTDWWLRVKVPEAIRPFMVEKGSVSIEGISLTIARWDGEVARNSDPSPYLFGDQPAHARGWVASESGGGCARETGSGAAAGTVYV